MRFGDGGEGGMPAGCLFESRSSLCIPSNAG
jgi:hypothetical protein